MRPRLRLPALLAGAAMLATCGPPEPPRNLLLVLVDTLRRDHVGHLGYARPTTPNLDALAAEGASFLSHSSHASRTGPSVASLLTGLHPRSHGVVNPLDRWDAKGILHSAQTTLAEILARRGFRTAGFVANPNVSARFGFAQGFDRYDLVPTLRAAELNAAALDWLAAAPQPFFLLLHYMEPHAAYAAPPPNKGRFVDPGYSGSADGTSRQLDRIVAGTWQPDPADLTQLRALYDQEILSFDAALGEVLAGLDARGLRNDTLVVITADHGEEFLDHGSALHGYTLYDEQLRVPLVIVDPRLRGENRPAASTRHVDVLPTLLELLEVPAPDGLQGRSLVPLLRGDPASQPEPPVLAEASLRAVRTVKLRSFSSGGWKLIQTSLPEPREELFHLAEDAGETHDLAAARPEVRERLRLALEEFLVGLPVGEGGSVALSADEAAQLRALGYLPPDSEQ